MSNLNVIIEKLLERPGMFGINKVEDLYFIFLGYELRINEKNNNENHIYFKFKTDFRQFVNEYFESKEDIEPFRLIRFYSGSDSHSLELFKRIYLNFKDN